MKQLELRAESWRPLAKASNYAFARFVCGRDRLRPEHLDWDVLTKNQYGLYLMPRESLKTTLFVESYITKYILDNPNGRVLLICDSATPARERVRAIQKYLESEAAAVYSPEIKSRIKNAVQWTESRIMFAGRDVKEPNLTACGVDQPATGGHYDLIIGDDVVNENDRSSDAVRLQKREWLPNLFYLGENYTQLWFIGTRWHPQDLYQTIIDEYPNFEVYLQSIYNADGTVWLPETYTPERIENAKRNPVMFSHQLLNLPIAGEDKQVYLEWFKDAERPAREDLILVVIGVDPAYSEKDAKKACYKAIAVMGVDKQKRVWLLDGAITHDTLETVRTEYLLNLYERWQPEYIRVEDNGPQMGAKLFFKTHPKYGNRIKGTKEIMVTDKLGRAQGWKAYAEANGILTVKGPWWREAAYQLDYFPQGDYVDFPDAMSCAWINIKELLQLGSETKPYFFGARNYA